MLNAFLICLCLAPFNRVLDVLQNFTANVVIDPPVRDWSFSSKNIAVVVLRDIPLTASRVHCSLRRSQHDSQAWFTNRVLSCSRLGNNSENRHLWSEVGHICENYHSLGWFGWVCSCVFKCQNLIGPYSFLAFQVFIFKWFGYKL